MCFDFSAISKSSGFAWKVIHPRLCFPVYLHVLQHLGKKHKEQLAAQGLGLMECCSRSYFQELGARSDPAGQILNPTSSRESWAGLSLGKSCPPGCPPWMSPQAARPGVATCIGLYKQICLHKQALALLVDKREIKETMGSFHWLMNGEEDACLYKQTVGLLINEIGY